ncbi:hypothetical protein ACLM5J_17365 [Nocardioides sp. Bht2]|uniref:hypothetical protein n=1 Tax=Nocardioides sp. Bht2 TaxID=3392297 RepID=UPI0039B457AC
MGLLTDACQARLTTPARLRATIEGRERVPGRAFLVGVLGDLADGTCSALEHGYRWLVASPHALPPGTQQAREATRSGLVFRDVVVGELVVELDGRLFHDNARQRDRDFARDLEAAAAGHRTLRLSWGQVYRHPCVTAARLAEVLRANGWSGSPSPCRRPDCVVAGSR